MNAGTADAMNALMYAQSRRAAFEAVLPQAAASGKVQLADIKALRDDFETKLRSVVNDRNVNRAHPYEQKFASSAMLAFGPLDDALTYCKDLFSKLSVVTGESSFVFHKHLWGASPENTARTLVDLVLFGGDPSNRLYDIERFIHDGTDEWENQRRTKSYDAIHARNDDTRNEHTVPDAGAPAALFNDPHALAAIPKLRTPR